MDDSKLKCKTGVPGLDDVLGGGFPRNCIYLIDGNPGVGKTTVALQFLLEGVRQNEVCLYVTLSETKLELEAVARSHGWDLSGIDIIELSAVERAMAGKLQNTMFQSAEVELTELSRLLLSEIERIKPARVVLDSLSEMRLLAQNPLRYRRQILTFKQKLADMVCTVLLLDDRSAVGPDVQVQSIVHGMVTLGMSTIRYGVFRRFLSVNKLRGVAFREGSHDYVIRKGGVQVFPRLVASEHHTPFERVSYSSGNSSLDALVGGGFHAGTANLLIGPAGSGKSTIAAMFALAAASRGECVGYYAFDESTHILLDRTRAMNMNLDELVKRRHIKLRQIDPAEIAPGQLAYDIVEAVTRHKTRVVVIDSLNGYVNAMPHEEYLYLHMHELLSYLNQQGVMTIMILAQHGLIGPLGGSVDVSYLADTVVLTRFFEAQGSIRKAISVIKKRSGPHEKAIRELTMSQEGVRVGEPLDNFEGVLTGVPKFLGGEMRPLNSELSQQT
jgi:circadian clock protein KaiC